MENLMGLLRIRMKRGINLAIRDVTTSDPYVVVRLGKQKLKTRVVNKCLNPEWNDDLTLCITDPNQPVKLAKSNGLLRRVGVKWPNWRNNLLKLLASDQPETSSNFLI